MKRFFLLFILSPAFFARADVSVSLLHAVFTANATIEVEVLVANRGSEVTSFGFGQQIEGEMVNGGQSWPLTLVRSQPETLAIEPGKFVVRSYSGLAPKTGEGRILLTIGKGLPTTVVAIVEKSAATAVAENPPAIPTNSAPREKTAASLIDRTFADHLAAHEPVYFIYGNKTPGAKFQFSFKYELAHFGKDTPGFVPDTMQFAYTQRSLWALTENSSPFYDTSYIPEFIFESLAPAPSHNESTFFTFLGYQTAARHESNGRAGPTSRSLNTVYFRTAIAIGRLDRWHLILSPELFTYVGGLSDNRNLADYRGHGQLRATIATNKGPSLLITDIPGRGFHKNTLQFDFTVPVHIPVIDGRTYLLIQYFDGYGESLLHYDQRSRIWRGGVSLVR